MDGVSPGIGTQSLLKTPLELKVETQIELLAARTAKKSLLNMGCQIRAGADGVLPGIEFHCGEELNVILSVWKCLEYPGKSVKVQL